MDKIKEGKKVLEFLFGSKACTAIVERLDKDKPGYSDYMFHSYGEFYKDETIDIKTKELLVVVALIIQKGAYPQLKGHLNGCKKVGLTKMEVCAAIIHLTMYVGFPSVVNALMLVDDVYEASNQ